MNTSLNIMNTDRWIHSCSTVRLLAIIFCIYSGLVDVNGQNTFGYPDPPDTYSSEPEAVGGIGSSFAVSPTGGAICTIPIEVPPGVGGMQPSIAITYNSQAGNGIAGWGCNIAGISAITRAPKTIYHDTQASGITFELADAFLLDGQRLIHYNTNYTEGTSLSVYHLENDPLTKVTVYGGYSRTRSYMLSDERWFQVERDGMTYYYGTTNNTNITDSQHKYSTMVANTTLHRINAWYLGYVEDVHGNYMIYNYTDKGDAGALYINSITYGKNTGSSSTLQNTVTFEYTGPRQDPITYVMEGVTVNMTRRLSGITTKTGTSTYRTYALTYNTTSDGSGVKYSRLTSVTVKNGVSEALKPVTLNWDYLPALSQTSSTPSMPSSITGDHEYYVGDFNGDGLTDIACIRDYPYNSANKYIEPYYTSITNGVISFTQGSGQQFDKSDYDKNWKSINGPLSTPDLFGTGKSNLFIPKHVDIKIGNSTIKQFQIFDYINSLVIYHNYIASPAYPLYNFADLDNNGKDECIIFEKNNYNNSYYGEIIKVNDDNSTVSRVQFSVTLDSKPEKMFVADFNGNGMNDLIVFYRNGYTIFWNTGNAAQPFSNNISNKTSGTNIADTKIMRIGDFNGDGLPDFLMNKSDPNWFSTTEANWYFALNKGNGTFSNELLACSLPAPTNCNYTNHDYLSCHVFDFDHDGKSDVVITKAMYTYFDPPIDNIYFDQTKTFWLRSTGTSLTPIATALSSNENDAASRFFVTGDFNGDGQVELINYGYNCYNGTTGRVWRLYSNPNYNVNKGKVASVTSSYGITTAIEYASLASSSIYNRGTSVSYPMVNCQPALHAVKTVTAGNGSAGSMTLNYRYAGIKLHLTGKGLLGMDTLTVHNVTTGTKNLSGVSTWNNTWYAPSKTYSIVKMSNYTEETTVDYSFIGNNSVSKKVFIHPSKKTEKEIENTTTISTVTSFYSFDANYNPTRDSVLYGNSSMYRVVRYGRYSSTQGGYRPRLVTSVQKHADDVPFVQKTRLEYNAKGLPSKKTENCNLADSLTTEFDYDVFGNRTSTRVSGAGVKPVATHTIYDATGRFPARQYTLPASAKAAFKYDTWGNVTEERDVTNPADTVTMVTAHQYDGWGVRTLTIRPGGLRVKYQTGWASTFASNRYFTLVQGDGIPWVKTWYDATGRETSVETVGPGGVAMKTRHGYNDHTASNPASRGQLYASTSSQGNQNLTVSEIYTYDSRGRVQTQISYSEPTVPGLSGQPVNQIIGKEVTYSYGVSNGKKYQTATINGKPYKKTFDAWGGLYESEDALGGKVSYQYHSSGQPKKITAAGIVYDMTYYPTGRQKTLVDPNAGTTTCTYDAAGRLKTQLDNRGTLTTMYYDRLGRDSCMVQGNISTAYTYGTANNYDLHRLIKMQTGNNYINYAHNQYGQLQTESRSIDGTVLAFTYQFNNRNQLLQTSYPNSLDVSNEYDAYGNLVKVMAGTQVVWEFTGNTGDVTTVALHGGVMTATEERNMMGYLTSLKTMKGSTPIRNMSFVFDAPTGNLTSRTGMITQKETFGYDNLARLKTVHHGTPGTLAMNTDYAANGNITSKSDLGTYAYHSMKKHAVEYIDSDDGPVITSGQAVGYNAFNKASWVVDTVGNIAARLDIVYGPDGQRWKTTLAKKNILTNVSQPVKTVLFAGDYERIARSDTTTHLYYIAGGIYVKQTKGSTVLKNGMYYVHPDHLGSMMIITDAAGSVKQKCSFDAWGKRTFTVKDPSLVFDRGFTGHEHLDELGLINMNGRMYDPVVGRFLSPDPYVQWPDYTQNFNRYSYCVNNPLKYTDPNGEVFVLDDLIIAMAISAVMNVAMQGMAGNINSGGDFLKAAGIGALAGAAGYGAGAWVGGALKIGGFAGGSLIGAAGGAAGGFVGGAGNAWTNGANFGQGLKAGFIGGGVGAASGALIGGFARGISAYRNGYNFWDGTKYSEFVLQPGEISAQNKRYAINYNKSSIADVNDEILLGRLKDEFNVSVGDYNIESISTKPDISRYGLTNSGEYINLKTGNLSGGYVRQVHGKINSSTLRISPHYVTSNSIDFRAVAGHELIHSYHIYTLGSAYNISISEGYAYRYTANTYFNAGYYDKAFSYTLSALTKGYWGLYNSAYRYPGLFNMFW